MVAEGAFCNRRGWGLKSNLGRSRRSLIALGMPSVTITQQKVLIEDFRPKDTLRLSESGIAFPFPVRERAFEKVFPEYTEWPKDLCSSTFGGVRICRFFSICFE
jgi:hypothetical protein